MPRFRRPSLFTIARVTIYLIAPIPLTRWWYDDGPMPAVKCYFDRATASVVPFEWRDDPIGWRFQKDALFYNIHLWYSQNRLWTRASCCTIAQALGVIGAASALLQSPHRRRGHCPACGYDLQGLAASPQGGLRCPECGAEGINGQPADTACEPKQATPVPPM